MAHYSNLKDSTERFDEYSFVRNTVLENFPSAKLEQSEQGYFVTWTGIRISSHFTDSYYAWEDVALPF